METQTIDTQVLKRAFTAEEYETILDALGKSLQGINDCLEDDYECCPTRNWRSYSGHYCGECIDVLPGVSANIEADARVYGHEIPQTYWEPGEFVVEGCEGSVTELSLWDENEEMEIEIPDGLMAALDKELKCCLL